MQTTNPFISHIAIGGIPYMSKQHSSLGAAVDCTVFNCGVDPFLIRLPTECDMQDVAKLLAGIKTFCRDPRLTRVPTCLLPGFSVRGFSRISRLLDIPDPFTFPPCLFPRAARIKRLNSCGTCTVINVILVQP